MNKFNEDYLKGMLDLGIIEEEVCSKEETNRLKRLLDKGESLPKGYRESKENSYVYIKMTNYDLSIEELQKLVLVNQAKNILTIKKCVVFFTELTVLLLPISIVLFFIISGR